MAAVLCHLKQGIRFILGEQLKDSEIMAYLVILARESLGHEVFVHDDFGVLASIPIAASASEKKAKHDESGLEYARHLHVKSVKGISFALF